MTSMRGRSLGILGVAIAACAARLVACAGSDDSTVNTTPTGPVLSGSPDAGSFAFQDDGGNDAGVLLVACNPASPDSCASGFTCFAQHTSATWWVDLYGTCTFDCTNQTDALCSSLDGVCGCPVLQGQASGNCSGDGGTAMVCVPAVKPGTTPGANEGDGGCGTPGCSGGAPVEAGPSLDDGGPG
jgi:hypothetical protein